MKPISELPCGPLMKDLKKLDEFHNASKDVIISLGVFSS